MFYLILKYYLFFFGILYKSKISILSGGFEKIFWFVLLLLLLVYKKLHTNG
jgi:hypothetical protein